MPVTWFDGVQVTARIALAQPGGPYAQWDDPAWGWDVGTWATGIDWIDVSAYLRRWSSTRTFRDDGTWAGGTGVIELDDADGRFDPDNPASPYRSVGVTSLQPWRPAQIQLTIGGVTTDVITALTGVFGDTPTSPSPLGGGVDTTEVKLVDEWTRLGIAGAPGAASAGAGELPGPRLHRILDAAGHRGSRDIEPGAATLQATTLTTAPVREIGLTADSGGFRVWIDVAGTFVGRDRRFLVESPRSTSVQATFTDDPDADIATDVGYQSYRTSPAGSEIHTEASYARVGGTRQVYADLSAQALHGRLVDDRDDLLNDNDSDVLGLATWRVAMDAVVQARPTEVAVLPRSNSAWRSVYASLREFDLVRFIRHKRSGYVLDRPCHIVGISHEMDCDGRWQMRFKLADATVPLQYAGSQWDVGAWAASEVDRTAGVCLWYPD